MGQVPFLAPSYPLGLLKSRKNFSFFFFLHLTSISPLRYHFHRAQNHFFHLFRPFFELLKKKISKIFGKFSKIFSIFSIFSIFFFLSLVKRTIILVRFSKNFQGFTSLPWQKVGRICWKSLKIDRNDVISRVFSPFFLSFFHSDVPI